MAEDKSGYVDYQGGKFLVVKGKLENTANGLVQDPDHPDDWYFLSGGQAQTQYTGLALYDGEWFYVDKGKLDTKIAAYIEYDGGVFYVAAGRILSEVNGLAQDPNGSDWYYLANGQVQNQYTGLAQYDGAWFYVERGRLAQEYLTMVEYDGAMFCSEYGMIVDLEKLTPTDAAIALCNNVRREQGISLLEKKNELSAAAQARSVEIIEKNDRIRPNGMEYPTILDEYGVKRQIQVENRAKGTANPQKMIPTWINGSGSTIQDNINNSDYKYIGVGMTINEAGVAYWVIMLIG